MGAPTLLRSLRLAEFRRWAEPRLVPLGPPDGLADADPSVLAPLDAALEGRRIVYLGEADHYVRELAAFRSLCLRYLLDRGFTRIGEELGTCDGRRIDRYLDDGDESWLHRLPSFGYRAEMRQDRDDSLAGVLAGQEYPDEAMRAEHADVAIRLRRHAGTRRVHWFGVDADIAPGGSYHDLEEVLGGGGPHAADLARRLLRVPGESIDAETARLEALLVQVERHRAELVAELGSAATDQVSRSLVALREGLAFVAGARTTRAWPDLGPVMARREAAMITLARSVLAGLPADERVVLLGHAGHLSKSSPSLRLPATGAGPAADTLGTVLARDRPGEVFCLWLLHASGQDSQPLPSLPRRYDLVPGTLNEALAQLGDCYLLPLTPSGPLPALLRREQDIRWIYGAGCRTRVTDQADAIVFIRDAHPLPGA